MMSVVAKCVEVVHHTADEVLRWPAKVYDQVRRRELAFFTDLNLNADRLCYSRILELVKDVSFVEE